MTDWASWIDVQNGADRRGLLCFDTTPRFIHTPRDLATYVHFDALYQAYLNACLIMIGLGIPGDRGLPEGMYAGPKKDPDLSHPTRDAFATFGVAHTLSLVTEVATRALKAARRQKFQVHLRARPEALAGVLAVGANGHDDKLGEAYRGKANDMVGKLEHCGIADFVVAHNKKSNAAIPDAGAKGDARMNWLDPEKNLLLPMAFPEGSPMHPCYAAGHATVAGACVTILKAFFEMYEAPTPPYQRGKTKLGDVLNRFCDGTDYKSLFPAEMLLQEDAYYRTDAAQDGRCLKQECDPAIAKTLTIQGELDKLAANIAIGRNFAGVHYYTDYYESLRMGERVAVGILQEQMLTYREPVSMRFRSFDEDYILLTGSGGSIGMDDAKILVRDLEGCWVDSDDWWHRAGDQSGWTRP